jgi:signal transduction histidine kinase
MQLKNRQSNRLSFWHRVKRTHHEGMKVIACVEAHEGFGVICTVGPRRIRATLRKQEISWDPDRQTLDELPVGSSFEAVIIGLDDTWRQLNLSRKAAEPSPIERFVAAHQVGELIDCEVLRLAPTVVVVRLAAGLEGEIPWKEMPQIPVPPVGELTEAWRIVVGDHLKATLVSVSVKSRNIKLSALKALEQIEAEHKQKGQAVRNAGLTKKRSIWASGPSSLKPTPLPASTQRLSILFVEDDDDIRQGMVGLLLDRRHVVIQASSIEGAKRELAKRKFDVIVLDLYLAGNSVKALIDIVLESQPESRLIAVSANYESLDRVAGTVIAIAKPFDPREVIGVVEGRTFSVPRVLTIDEGLERFSHTESSSSKHELAEQPISLQSWQVIDEYLQSMAEIAAPSKVAMLTHSNVTNQVNCIRAVGLRPEIFASGAKTLRFSPLGDVLAGYASAGEQSEEHFWGTEEDEGFRSNREVIRNLGCNRFIGFPLEINTQTAPFGVFVFLPHTRSRLTMDQHRELQHLARSLALEVDSATWEAQILRHQRSLSVGSLMLGMTHELRNAVSAIRAQAERMQSTVELIRKKSRSLDDLDGSLASFGRQAKLLEDSFESLLSFSRRTTSHHVAVETVLEGVVDQCIHSANQSNILVSVKCDTSLQSKNVPNSVSQVLLNLLLNAIQHTRAYRRSDGLIELRVSEQNRGGRSILAFRVCDTGFGMDWNFRERCFEMFQTTRTHGSGLGLFVSQLIAQSLDGRLEVESSFKYAGTTFLLEVPA